MKSLLKFSKKQTLIVSISICSWSSSLLADSLFCGGEDTVERTLQNRFCDVINYTIHAPCGLTTNLAQLKCDMQMPREIPNKIQILEDSCQERCADYAASTTASAMSLTCKKRPQDECQIPCKPSSSSQDGSCNVTIVREVDAGTPRTDGSCQYTCINRFRWSFYASIVRTCSDCVPN